MLSTRFSVRTVLYVVIAILAISVAYSVQSQANLSGEGRAIEAGLIESGDRPAVYFSLRNIMEGDAEFTYVIAYNSTDRMTVESSSITVPPGGVFRHTLSLMRPSSGVMVVSLWIHRGGEINDDSLLYEQTWIARARA